MAFALDLQKFAEKAKERQDDVVRQVVIDIGMRIVFKSPVGDRERWAVNIERATRGLPPVPPGYVGGRFRGNWQYGFNEVPTGDLPTIDPSGGASIKRLIAGAQGHPAAGIHYVANNLPYAKRLEEGWSKQAPVGMVALTISELQSVVNRAAK